MKNNKVDTWRAGAKRLSIFSPNLVHHHDENDSTTKSNNDESSPPHVKIVEPHPHQSAADVSLYSSSSNASIGSLGSRVRVHQTERVEQVEKTPTKKESILDHLLHFWRKFSVICLSPIFLRHRNIFIVAFEVFVPAFVAFVIFAAFTSGISWKMVNANKHSKERNSLEVPDLTMETAMAKFREVHADSSHHVLIFYTPITPYTTLVMKQAIKLLKLADNNRVETHKHHTVGILGAESEIEMIERALLHRKERTGHGVPIGVRFEYNETDIEPDLGVPYDLKYAIYSFNESIHQTADNYPFVAPPESKSYLSPYVASGFLGLQYAIDRAVIDIVILKQMPEEDVDEKKKEEQQFKEKIQKLFRLQLMRQFSTSTETEILGNMTMTSTYSSDTTNPTTAEPTITGPPTTEPTRYTYTSTNGDSSTTDYPTTTEDPATMDDPSTRTNTTTELNNKNYLRRITRPSDLPTIKLKMFTFANFRSEHFRNLVAFVVTYGLVVAYSFMAFFIVRQIVQENISGIKDLLQMHGMPHYIHWFCLFFHALFFRAITSALVVAALKINFGHGAIIEATSASVLFTFVLVHQVALSFMNFFIATCIRSTQMCGVVAIFCGVLSFYIPETFDGMKLIGIYTNYGLAAIFPNWTLRHVLRTLIDFESDEKGVAWTNIMDTNHSTNKVSVGMGIFILTGTGVVYFFMAAYHDMTGASMLFPPTRKWYDFKERSRQRKETKLHQEELHKDIAEGRTTNFEKPAVYQEPEKDRKCFVHVRHVSKRYGKHKVALDSVSMNIMHEEITVILGHTNSGKSTLMAILSGMMMPSSGYAIVKGYDVNFEAKEARKYVGLCTQQMVAFNLLTVREHITLCYRLRGYSKKDCDRHGATLLQRLRLWHIRSFLPDRLKVDEMRRLGIALAMADAPKVLLLDEPTGGMDPTGRREVWDILLTLKNHHTIILTTNCNANFTNI
ncbi:unnamed protein product [Orchesella dallaii]|uniref:ABC transporter domain-containing protein n=1 Tax=Orchesella dallaii TaxID=48710 RepID=A0ABP1PLK3_9HEXA